MTEKVTELIDDTKGIILAGNAEIKDKVYGEFSDILKAKVVRRITIDTNASVENIIERCADILCNDGGIESQLNKYIADIVTNTRLVYGRDDVLYHYENGLLETLYTTEEHPILDNGCKVVCVPANSIITKYGGLLGIKWY